MTNIQTIERPQLFKALEEYIILWSNVTVKYIDTLKAVIKEAVTPKRTDNTQSTNNIEKTLNFKGKEFTLNMINYEIDVLADSIEHLRDEICFEEQDTPAGSFNKRLFSLETKLINHENDMLEIIDFKKYFD